MGIENYSLITPVKIQRDISNQLSISNFPTLIAPENYWYEVIKHSFVETLIYSQSKVDLVELQKTSVLISYKTSNNQLVLDTLPFYVFNNIAIALNEVLEQENNGSSDEQTSAGSQFEETQKSFKSSMSSMSRNMLSGKSSIPKLKP